ncbi:Crp/Fnr family transcriptional regulator [Salinicoccus siamensis]|uniref:HTH-type transcriptional regulator ArcR n=1 Tax=Salinicoccus siamensis TaxID=381830 RepID=A0ABV5Z3C8_9STAP
MEQHANHKMCVRKVPIFNHLNDKEMDEVFNQVNSKTYKRQEHLYMAGDPENALFVLHRGKIRIYRLNEEGKEQLIRVLLPGDFTGELALFGGEAMHDSYAEAAEESKVCEIQKKELYTLLKEYPEIGIKIIERFSERLSEVEQQTTNISLLSSEERLIEFIRTDVDENDRLKLSMTKKDLASYLSMQPETLTRLFKKLEQDEILERVDHKTYILLDYSIL